ncbi:MAG: ECF transporter S component [Oscillospiraceae bacterium]|nr:ECF transporter S component [Oscillospiraceae bacterium]
MSKKQYFTTRQLCLMAFLAVSGMIIKPFLSPVFNLLTDFIRIPGGSVTAGFSMMFLVFGAAAVQKKGTAAMMGLVQAVMALGLGISSVTGLLVFITYTLPGVVIDIVLCSSIFSAVPVQKRMPLAGAAGVLAGAALTNTLYFRMSVVPFLLFYIFGILSGGFGGYMAAVIYDRLHIQIERMRYKK